MMFTQLKSMTRCDIGIDLGTANSVVYKENHGIIIREPSVVAFDQQSQSVLSIGDLAYEMVGKTPASIIAIRPLKDGVISDYQTTEAMIRHFLNLSQVPMLRKIRLLVGVPYGITNVERRAVLDAASMAGAKECFLIEEPMAAAIGAGHDVFEPSGQLVVDIGGGTTEVAVISLGGIVVSESIRIAGDEIDQAIINHCRKNYNLLIGDRFAEKIKVRIGSVLPFKEERQMEVTGRDLLTGLPKTFTLSSMEIRDSIEEPVLAIVSAIRRTLELTPPELSSDIFTNGITLTGGGALLYGLTEFIAKQMGIDVFVADDPLSCVALGTGKVLDEMDRYVNRIIYN
ncbi:MAG: rod shape-determining protein [Candidatus Marinamargulisbacteria bacterium]